MATFKSYYTTSELLKVLDRRSLIPLYWSKENGLYTFYFLDNRRCPKIESGYYSFVSHKANYYRLRNKLNALPFRLKLDPRSKSAPYNYYLYTLVPDSCFINDFSEHVLKHLNDVWNGQLTVNVVVI